MNVHTHLRSLDNTVLVQGSYLYYHYEPEDLGWGCAYRSLQTLFSFFIYNHYVETVVPSIPEVGLISDQSIDSRDTSAYWRQG